MRREVENLLLSVRSTANAKAPQYIIYKGSGRGRLGAPRPPWRVRVECEEVFVLELSGTHELHTINTTYQVADVRPSGLR